MKAKELTPNLAKNLIGKTIEWFAPSSQYNLPYEGVALIKAIDLNKRNVIVAETISGDDLNYAFNEWKEGTELNDPLCYSDGGRHITFTINEN